MKSKAFISLEFASDSVERATIALCVQHFFTVSKSFYDESKLARDGATAKAWGGASAEPQEPVRKVHSPR